MRPRHAFRKAFVTLMLLMGFSLTVPVDAWSENLGKAAPFDGKRIEVNGIHLNVFDQGEGEVELKRSGKIDFGMFQIGMCTQLTGSSAIKF